MSNTELELDTDQLLITKSDPNGKITYCNRRFIEFSGYTEQQLIGQSYDLIRHPQMPCGLFYLMWQTLKQKREFNGFIKNKTKNNDEYWAFINITPSYNVAGQLTGYTSASRQPNPAAIMMFSMYYEQMLEHENGQRHESAAQQSLNALLEQLSIMGDDYEASVFKLQFS